MVSQLRESLRDRRPRGDLGRELRDDCIELGRGHHPADQADPIGLGRVEEPGTERAIHFSIEE